MFNPEKPEVAAAQKKMLEILCEIHRICVENDITYWLSAGTLLGAVRHKGFIPWDDDCDVGMMRSDYVKFLKIAPQHLPSNMHLQTKKTEPEAPFVYAKIRLDGTILLERSETGKENYHHGVFVDIFPYDKYSSKAFLKWMHWGKHFRSYRKKYRPHSFMRFLVTFYTNFILFIPGVLTKMVCKLLDGHFGMYGDEKSKYISFGLECAINPTNLVEDYFPVKLMDNCFEGCSFCVPANSDAVLRAQYGNSYMELPPVEKRGTHAKLIEISN